MPMPTRQLFMRFPASLRYLNPLRQTVEAFCADVIAPETHAEQVYQVLLAVSELATNIIVHANNRDGAASVEVALAGDNGAVALDFYDWGREYVEKTPSLPDPESLAEGGYGSFIIQQCVDRVSYERDGDGRNHWHLEKAFGMTGGT
jgi:anti-sigma regulatory factor (Ser/Thr protein kinase)